MFSFLFFLEASSELIVQKFKEVVEEGKFEDSYNSSKRTSFFDVVGLLSVGINITRI